MSDVCAYCLVEGVQRHRFNKAYSNDNRGGWEGFAAHVTKYKPAVPPNTIWRIWVWDIGSWGRDLSIGYRETQAFRMKSGLIYIATFNRGTKQKIGETTTAKIVHFIHFTIKNVLVYNICSYCFDVYSYDCHDWYFEKFIAKLQQPRSEAQ